MSDLVTRAFPDFGEPLPVLGGFLDDSWTDDACPSLFCRLEGETGLKLWVDYADPTRRECGGNRYVLSVSHESNLTPVLWTDDFSKVQEVVGLIQRDFKSGPTQLLCVWNWWQIVELHTEESLRDLYKETNLFDFEQAWATPVGYFKDLGSALKRMEEGGFVSASCDNATIFRISAPKEAE